jgi:hypothetical protein
MKNIKDKKLKKFTPKFSVLTFTRTNYILFFAGIFVIIIGYKFLSIAPVDSVYSLTIAPILLVMGYLGIIPIAIFWRPKKKESQ